MRKLLRRTAVTLLAILLAILTAIQLQQRLLRHRAEQLHADILALQLHPGTFADLQRLQQRWGAHAHYDGTCTAQHCIYGIYLLDFSLHHLPSSQTESGARRTRALLQLYRLLGGRPARALASVQLRNDRIWGESFSLQVFAYPGIGRNEGQWYFVSASVDASPRTLDRTFPPDYASNHPTFRTAAQLMCLGCEYVSASVSQFTTPADVERFNRMDFSCLTRWTVCRHPSDLAPDLWKQATQDQQTSPHPIEELCLLPASTLAREAEDITLGKVVALVNHPAQGSVGPYQSVTVKRLQRVKNDTGEEPDQEIYAAPPNSVYGAGLPGPPLTLGQSYFFLYHQPSPQSVFGSFSLEGCLAVPISFTADILRGVTDDGSTGEPYDYMNQPGYTSLTTLP